MARKYPLTNTGAANCSKHEKLHSYLIMEYIGCLLGLLSSQLRLSHSTRPIQNSKVGAFCARYPQSTTPSRRYGSSPLSLFIQFWSEINIHLLINSLNTSHQASDQGGALPCLLFVPLYKILSKLVELLSTFDLVRSLHSQSTHSR